MTNNTIPNVPRELKPCPFCGSEAGRATKKATWNLSRHRVACTNSGCGAHYGYWHPIEWNARALLSAPSPAGVDGLEVYITDCATCVDVAPAKTVTDAKVVLAKDAQAIIDGLRDQIHVAHEKVGRYADQRDQLSAELAAIKAQGVVMPRNIEKSFLEWASAQLKAPTQLAAYMAGADEVARLNAAPVQRVSVPQCVLDWFEAKQAHVTAVDAYNARLAFVREHMPFGTSVDPEYQIMEEADRKVRNLVWPMFSGLRDLNAAPAAPAADVWISVSERLPSVAAGKAIEVIVAVKRKHNGQVYVFTTEYLNCVQVNQDGQFVQDDDNDNAAITGWFYLSDDEETWHRTLGNGDELLAWQYKPAYAAHSVNGVV